MTLEHRIDRPHGCVLVDGPLVVVQYAGPQTVEETVADFAVQKGVLAAHGQVWNLVVFEANKVGKPDERVRQKVAEQLLELGDGLKWTAIVVRGTGLAPLVMRTMLTGLALLSRTATRQKVLAAIPDAMEWLKACPGVPSSLAAVSVPSLAAALEKRQ